MVERGLSIRLLGPIEVGFDGVSVELPPSKKSRALLAYLVVTARPHRRQRLCELFWDLSDDPRGLLRWSLSRLRKVLNRGGVERLAADRSEVAFRPIDVDVDLVDVKRGSVSSIGPAEAGSLVRRFRGDFLHGLDLPDALEFSSWKAAQSDECRGYLETLLEAALATNAEPETALRYARRFVELRPRDVKAHATLIRLLGEVGRMSEAEERFRAAKHLLGTGPSYPVLTEAWRVARESPSADVAVELPRRPAADTAAVPAVAVLPFDDLSGNAEEECFADGMCEEIITELARARLFPVIARNSSFAFKGRAFDIREVGEQLGAQYVVEGSVRRAADRIRVIAQLIDASTGQHVWANRFDRPLGDIFEVQEEIAQHICAALRPELVGAEQQRLRRSPPRNLEAWQELVMAWRYGGLPTAAELDRLREHGERAITLDPTLASAHATLGASEIWRLLFSLTDAPQETLALAIRHAQNACSLDPEDAIAHRVLTWVNFFLGQFDQALIEGRLAIELNPSDAIAYASLGSVLVALGRLEEGRGEVQRALALSPRDHLRHLFWVTEATSFYLEERYEEAAASASACIRANPDSPYGYFNRGAALAQLGRIEEARRCFEDGCICRPNPDRQFFVTSWPLRVQEHMDLVLEGMRKSGWTG